MSKNNSNSPSVEELESKARSEFEEIIGYCIQGSSKQSWMKVEEDIKTKVFALAVVIFELFLAAVHTNFNYDKPAKKHNCYSRIKPRSRTIKTFFGPVTFWRCYLEHRNKSGGFFPLDAALGICSDGFSHHVISLATRLASRMSFNSCTIIVRSFLGYSPSTDSIEQLVLGLGQQASAYMETLGQYDDDGEVLIIEVDGKATPTATQQELKKRRGKRNKNKSKCQCPGKGTCQRHRNKIKRKKAGKKKATRKKVAKKRAFRRVPTELSREIDRRFDFVNDLGVEQTQACIRLRAMTKKLAKAIARDTPVCREQSLAITKLEEALHFTIAAIVRPRGDH